MFTLEELLIETDPDLTLAATMVIGFDDNGHLALEYRVTDCNNPLETRIKYVSVDKEDAYVLAKKVNVGATKLLQKSEMRKEIVIELSYKGFSRASDYS